MVQYNVNGWLRIERKVRSGQVHLQLLRHGSALFRTLTSLLILIACPHYIDPNSKRPLLIGSSYFSNRLLSQPIIAFQTHNSTPCALALPMPVPVMDSASHISPLPLRSFDLHQPSNTKGEECSSSTQGQHHTTTTSCSSNPFHHTLLVHFSMHNSQILFNPEIIHHRQVVR